MPENDFPHLGQPAEPSPPPRPRTRRDAFKSMLAISALVTAVILAYLWGSYLLDLNVSLAKEPTPAQARRVEKALVLAVVGTALLLVGMPILMFRTYRSICGRPVKGTVQACQPATAAADAPATYHIDFTYVVHDFTYQKSTTTRTRYAPGDTLRVYVDLKRPGEFTLPEDGLSFASPASEAAQTEQLARQEQRREKRQDRRWLYYLTSGMAAAFLGVTLLIYPGSYRYQSFRGFRYRHARNPLDYLEALGGARLTGVVCLALAIFLIWLSARGRHRHVQRKRN